ncbi:survival protein sure-like phosphatase/nucleotidase [Dunaliella salina]|uniref:Survival protein sure-like phosphatase/nucleotidase n=1 Tax=Dunaliella salina TaxID=3046 RepID=A0ABQ7G3M4_DUNSA|nr:survival protein sure-like phosphatase/nucleotidase [Dunaliella salina]|eukprot:KAF5829209.1 survival protein sure-like phosphatase/nucleotidase [Dunaliella salina]
MKDPRTLQKQGTKSAPLTPSLRPGPPAQPEWATERFCSPFPWISVCAPNGERSAQSHAITLGQHLTCQPWDMGDMVHEAYAVDGTPADTVMLALNSPLFQPNTKGGFDAVVSGINRGDNCGLHVIYSGTVGAAREAACKGIPAIAFSLDNHMARKLEDYATSAQLSVAILKAMLGMLPPHPSPPPADALKVHDVLLNVNYPMGQGELIQGLYLTHQSLACAFPAFKELHPSSARLEELSEAQKTERVFRNYFGSMQEDESVGGDGWAIKNGWVSITPIGLRSDIESRTSQATVFEPVMQATADIVKAAAADTSLEAGGVAKL